MIQTGLIQNMPVGARLAQIYDDSNDMWVSVDIPEMTIEVDGVRAFTFLARRGYRQTQGGFRVELSINRNTTVKWEI
ncbi:hypothetical protein [Gibbsiella quercinecans]|uniref:hypothetical protein n=1 Tax=Gibbsiella quercinecans TaxID=929813 RepID=UPI00242A9FD8|nr:hypothetical protein [Gibbsiella quercinecans]